MVEHARNRAKKLKNTRQMQKSVNAKNSKISTDCGADKPNKNGGESCWTTTTRKGQYRNHTAQQATMITEDTARQNHLLQKRTTTTTHTNGLENNIHNTTQQSTHQKDVHAGRWWWCLPNVATHARFSNVLWKKPVAFSAKLQHHKTVCGRRGCDNRQKTRRMCQIERATQAIMAIANTLEGGKEASK